MVTPLHSLPVSRSNHGIKVVCSCTMHCPAERLYAFWRQLENLPQVMPCLVSVKQVSATESHWIARGPGNKQLEWDVEIINEIPSQLIAWITKDGFALAHAGSVRFEPAALGEGTEVTVSLEYDQPDRRSEAMAARLFGREPGARLAEDLRRLKAMVENGASQAIPPAKRKTAVLSGFISAEP